jgi:hypothetical protein
MLRKSGFYAVVVVLCCTNAFSETSAEPDSSAYSQGFSSYLWQTDKFAAGFDITTDSEGNIYMIGGTHSSDFPVTDSAYDTGLGGK